MGSFFFENSGNKDFSRKLITFFIHPVGAKMERLAKIAIFTPIKTGNKSVQKNFCPTMYKK